MQPCDLNITDVKIAIYIHTNDTIGTIQRIVLAIIVVQGMHLFLKGNLVIPFVHFCYQIELPKSSRYFPCLFLLMYMLSGLGDRDLPLPLLTNA